MMTILHRLVVVVFALITLVACAAFPTPTPTPLPPELARTWYLTGVVVNGETEPPFAENQGIKIIIKPTGGITWYDGCNHRRGRVIVSDSGRFSISYGVTKVYCAVIDTETGEEKEAILPGYAQLDQVMGAVVAYELREKELWLYYPKSKSNALVFR